MPDGTVLRTHEVFVHRLPEHIEQRAEIVLDIQYHNRVQIQSELLPSDDFQQLEFPLPTAMQWLSGTFCSYTFRQAPLHV